jgi:hypothetical protein
MNVNRAASSSALALTPTQQKAAAEMQWVENATRLLDTRFRIPGTNIRFGADFLMGLVPGAGDLLSMMFSGMLIATMAKNGASGKLVARMLVNVLLDTIVGAVPILGNVFDLFYKANRRNFILMKEHYQEGKHTGSAWPIMIAVIGIFLFLFVAFAFLIALFLRMLWSTVSAIT